MRTAAGMGYTARAGRLKKSSSGSMPPCARSCRCPTRASSFAALNLEPIGSSPEEFAKFLKNDLEKYAAIAKAVGIKPE